MRTRGVGTQWNADVAPTMFGCLPFSPLALVIGLFLAVGAIKPLVTVLRRIFRR